MVKQLKGPCAALLGSSTPAQQESNGLALKMWGRGGDITQAMLVVLAQGTKVSGAQTFGLLLATPPLTTTAKAVREAPARKGGGHQGQGGPRG